MPEEVLGKPILEKVPGELRVKFMLVSIQTKKRQTITLVVPFQSHFDELSGFVRFDACWQNVAIYTLLV